MTIDEAIQLASNGNVEAMGALGRYYLDKYLEQKDVVALRDAWKWFVEAAKHGRISSAGQVMEICHLIAIPYEKMGAYARAYECWNEGYDCAMLVQKVSDAPEAMKERARSKLPRIIYGLGYDLFCLERYDDAITFFRILADVYGNKRAKVLLGLCYSNVEEDMEKVYSMLKTLEDGDVVFEDTGIQYWAWMSLALIYRVMNDIQSSYNCVQEAAKIPGDIGEDAREELKKYRKSALGEYTYQE